MFCQRLGRRGAGDSGANNHEIGPLHDLTSQFDGICRMGRRKCRAMTTQIYTHPACLDHDMGAGHPERPARLEAILAALRAPDFTPLGWREAPRADIDQIARAHPRAYVEAILDAVPRSGRVTLDADTSLSAGSGEAALRAAGAVCTAVDAVAAGEASNAFCAVRPPGHHAEPATAMGFCLFNNVAIGAQQARSRHRLKRIAVMDFDVHHGNGTQVMFEKDPELFYASTHQMPLYPGSGAAAETGCGNICNAPLPPNSGSAEFRAAMKGRVLPAIDAFRPDMILVSAGFDAHRADPLANLRLEEADYGWATDELLALASRHCGGRVVSTLEGGYDLAALAASAAAHVRQLMAA
jgi:acetoin utilization deacetylase AcuC-like enzyme